MIPMVTGERLQKIIASAGITSRRKAELLITGGRVTVNGKVVDNLGAKADPVRDHIKVDGKLIHADSHKVYILLNKPKGVMSTVTDPQGRPKVTDLVRLKERIYPVGRLDYQTEGLILLTNDGEFSRMISSAGEAFPKVYAAKVRGTPEETDLNRLRAGCRLPDGRKFAPCRIRVLREENNSWLEITLTEGKNREIREMFDLIRHPVVKLKRMRIGFLSVGKLPVGGFRFLTPGEVARALRLGEAAAGKSKR